MTDYSFSHRSSHGWRRQEIQKNWRSLLGAFIIVILILAIFNGFNKSISFKNYLGERRWDGKSSFVAALGTFPASVLIYQIDPKRIVLAKFGDETYFETGKFDKPLVKPLEIIARANGQELARAYSIALGSNIKDYIIFEKKTEANRNNLEEGFKKFASVTTPFVLLSGKIGGEVENTNITRLDMFRLWWRVKGLGINHLELVDLGSFSEEIVTADNTRVLGVDRVSLNKKIRDYLEVHEFLESNFKIEVLDASGFSQGAELAANFITSVGLEVVNVSVSDNILDKSRIMAGDKNSNEAKYLANLFECDIFSESKPQKEVITVVVGQDLAREYFE